MIRQPQTDDLTYAAELKHWDETYQALTGGYNEAVPDQKTMLDAIGPRLESAKKRFYVLNEQQGQVPENDFELDGLLDDVRDLFRKLDDHKSSGPPLA